MVCREFEENQVKGQQMRNQKRLEFSELITKLDNQLSYERQRNPHTHGRDSLRFNREN